LNEQELLDGIRRGDAEALTRAIDRYAGYVGAIVRNIIQPPLQSEDVEELVSDVFLCLWEKADTVRPGSLRSWLAAVTRNRAKDRLRRLRLSVPLEEDALSLACEGPEESSVRQEIGRLAREAVEELGEPDRSIFLRFYYFYQKTGEIAEAMGLEPGTVRTRLSRGREKLRAKLEERGLDCETAGQ